MRDGHNRRGSHDVNCLEVHARCLPGLPGVRPGKRTAYWYGAGGALSLADVERGITLTYTMNQCQSGRNMLNGVYYDAFYDSL